MLGRKRRISSAPKSESSFLVKLYTILNENSYSEFIHWSPEGVSVIISDMNGFTKNVLPKFFNHHNFSSFIRQLNMYNFHKVKGDKKGEQIYMHNEFNQLKSKEEISTIKKKKKSAKPIGPVVKYKNILDKKLGVSTKNEDKNYLEQFDLLDEESKLKEYELLLQKGEVSNFVNERLLNYFLEKSKENEENKKFEENAISNLKKQNEQLKEELKSCQQMLISQNDSCKEMKKKIVDLLESLKKKISSENFDSKRKLRAHLFKCFYKKSLKKNSGGFLFFNSDFLLPDLDLDLKSRQSSKIIFHDNNINNSIRPNLNNSINPLFNNTTMSKF